MASKEVIPVSTAEFDDEAVLNALYEVSDGSYNSYSLAVRLRPTASPTGEDGGKAFTEVLVAIERLIAQRLVGGKRMTGASGVYFAELKLTRNGERKAIELKHSLKPVALNLPDPSEE